MRTQGPGRAAIAFGLLTVALCTIGLLANSPDPEIIAAAQAASWQIEVLSGEDRLGGASAVALRSRDGETIYLTARHVHVASGRGDRALIQRMGEPKLELAWERDSEIGDLALAKALGGPFAVAPIATVEPAVGEMVLAACYGGEVGETPLILVGHVVGYWEKTERRYPEESLRLMLTDLHGTPGVSGSGVYNMAGELVGIQVSKAERSLECAVALTEIREFLGADHDGSGADTA